MTRMEITDHRPDPKVGDPNLDLAGVQGAVWELIVAPEGVAKALEEGPGRREALAALLAGDERATAEERLDVYANMYFFRIKAALEEDFPRTAAVLGEARWHNLVTDYLLAHPSTHWSLRWVGRRLPAFVRARSGREGFPPWLGDLSELEWARGAAFQAEDAPAATRADLAAVAPERWGELRFAAVPGAQLLVLGWDVPAAWDALEEQRGSGGPVPDVPVGPRTVLVYREAGDDAHEALEGGEAHATRMLFEGRDFAEVCETFLPAVEDAAEGTAEISPEAAEAAGARAVALLVSLVDRGVLRLARPAGEAG